MKLLIDDANIDKIRKIYEFYTIDGVTTNPSILAKSGRKPYEVLKEIRELLGENAELHVQVVSDTAEKMVQEGHKIVEMLGKNTYIKVPTIPEGLKAMRILSKEGYNITATAIYTPLQAYLAAKAGADYAAPYVNRIDNLGTNGIEVTRKIHDIFKNNGFKTEILAASFKNSLQVLELCEYGVGAATVAPDVIEGFINNTTNISEAVKDFTADFENLCGEGKTMLDCD
jgi:fructose-6-phosphate aldolase 2